MELNNQQKLAVQTDANKVLVAAGAGVGKALENGTMVYTNSGPKAIESLLIGEKIYCEDGELHEVIGVYPQGKKKKYRITFSDKNSIVCCNEHLWTFQTKELKKHKSNKWLTLSLQEIIDNYPLYIGKKHFFNFFPTKLKLKSNIFLPMSKAVNFSKKKLPMDPYTFGLGLGMLNFKKTNYPKVITEYFHTFLQELNFYIYCSEGLFVPSFYKYSSVEDRLALLGGLIDVIGHYNGITYKIDFKTKKLALNVKEICESLGFTVIYSEKQKDCEIIYKLKINTSQDIKKIYPSLKSKIRLPFKHYARRSISSIEELDEYAEMTCIQVDNPTSLFLTNNFIVTHNTRVIMERIKFLLERGVEGRKIYAITFTNAAAAEMKERLDDKAEDVFIGTIHSLANKILVMNGIDTSSHIEDENFDWLLEQIYEKKVEVPIIEHLLVDEFQDICENEYNFITKDLKAKNWFFCGDSQQCQPMGTKVKLRNNTYKNIENIKIGDSVIWYDQKKNFVCAPNIKDNNTLEKKVEEVTCRDFCNDYLITVVTENGRTTKYTPNHRTFVKLNKTGEIVEIYACNLIPEIMSCLIYNPESKDGKQYETIKRVIFENITEPIKVYSLKVDGGTYVADDIITHNSIYSFKGANFGYFMGLTIDPSVTVFKLNENYRCGEDIIDFGESFLCSIHDIYRVKNLCMNGKKGYVETCIFSIDRILEELENSANYGDWFILCRTNAEVNNIITALQRNNIPCDSFKRSELELSELNNKMKENTVKVLTIHSSKGLENKNVIVIGANTASDEEKRICYVAATRAKENLIWMNSPRNKKRYPPKLALNFSSFGEF